MEGLKTCHYALRSLFEPPSNFCTSEIRRGKPTQRRSYPRSASSASRASTAWLESVASWTAKVRENKRTVQVSKTVSGPSICRRQREGGEP